MLKWLAVACVAILVICFAAEMNQSSKSAPPAPAVQPTPEQLAKAKQCETFLKKQPYVKTWESDGTYVTAVIRPSFFDSDYDVKKGVAAALVCWATDGRMDDSIHRVEFQDWRTHQTVAEWSKYTGLKVNQAE